MLLASTRPSANSANSWSPRTSMSTAPGAIGTAATMESDPASCRSRRARCVSPHSTTARVRSTLLHRVAASGTSRTPRTSAPPAALNETVASRLPAAPRKTTSTSPLRIMQALCARPGGRATMLCSVVVPLALPNTHSEEDGASASGAAGVNTTAERTCSTVSGERPWSL